MEATSGNFADGVAHEACEEVGARDVHVGEVGAVGLVHVEVDFEEGRVGLRYDGLEEGVRRDGRGLHEDLVPVGLEEA